MTTTPDTLNVVRRGDSWAISSVLRHRADDKCTSVVGAELVEQLADLRPILHADAQHDGVRRQVEVVGRVIDRDAAELQPRTTTFTLLTGVGAGAPE